MTIRTKADVQIHIDGYAGPGVPAFNVKMRRYVDDLPESEWADVRADLGLTATDFGWAWCQAHMTIEEIQRWTDEAATGNYDAFAEQITETFPGATCNTEGRSGGWVIVNGLPDIESWDAVMLAKWRKLDRIADEYVADVPRETAWLIGANRYEAELSAFSHAEERRNDLLADAATDRETYTRQRNADDDARGAFVSP